MLPLEGSQSQIVPTTKQGLRRDDTAAEPRFLYDENAIKKGFHAAITTPLISKGKVVGTFSLRSHRIAAFGDREQAILERLASQIAPAIENSQLYLQLQERTAERPITQGIQLWSLEHQAVPIRSKHYKQRQAPPGINQ